MSILSIAKENLIPKGAERREPRVTKKLVRRGDKGKDEADSSKKS